MYVINNIILLLSIYYIQKNESDTHEFKKIVLYYI